MAYPLRGPLRGTLGRASYGEDEEDPRVQVAPRGDWGNRRGIGDPAPMPVARPDYTPGITGDPVGYDASLKRPDREANQGPSLGLKPVEQPNREQLAAGKADAIYKRYWPGSMPSSGMDWNDIRGQYRKALYTYFFYHDAPLSEADAIAMRDATAEKYGAKIENGSLIIPREPTPSFRNRLQKAEQKGLGRLKEDVIRTKPVWDLVGPFVYPDTPEKRYVPSYEGEHRYEVEGREDLAQAERKRKAGYEKRLRTELMPWDDQAEYRRWRKSQGG